MPEKQVLPFGECNLCLLKNLIERWYFISFYIAVEGSKSGKMASKSVLGHEFKARKPFHDPTSFILTMNFNIMSKENRSKERIRKQVLQISHEDSWDTRTKISKHFKQSNIHSFFVSLSVSESL